MEFQLPRQGGARRGGHDDGGSPSARGRHPARGARGVAAAAIVLQIGPRRDDRDEQVRVFVKLSKKEVIAIGPPRAPARENPAGIDAGERVGTTARRRSGASPRPDAYRVAARPAPPPPPTARRGLPSAPRAAGATPGPRRARPEAGTPSGAASGPGHSIGKRGSNSNVRSCGQKQACAFV